MSTATDMKTPSDEGKEKGKWKGAASMEATEYINASALKHHKLSKEKLEYRKEIDDKWKPN